MSDKELRARIKRMNELLDAEQIPSDYLALRVSFVHVRKSIFGLQDEVLGDRILIPPNRQEAKKLAQEFFTICDQEGDKEKGIRFEHSP
jgi:hypothetical protein